MKTRDEVLADEIGEAQIVVGGLRRQIGGLVEHATQNDATAHAAMYGKIVELLTTAWDSLADAWSIMAEGDAEDYVIGSDDFHPVIGFDGEAYDTLDGFVRKMRGFGVTLVLEDGSHVDAVLSRPVFDEESERLLIEFYRVTDGVYPTIESVLQKNLETAFVKRIQVA